MSLALPVFYEERVRYANSPKPRNREKAGYLSKRLTTLYLAGFSVATTWRGASEIVLELRYALGFNFSFLLVAPPSNPNFCACIAWKPTADTIVRYKLWEDVGEILYVPLYNGELIGGNFSIEIWNVKPAAGTGGLTITDDDGNIITTDEGDEIETDEGGGSSGIASSDGLGLFHLSRMILPVGFCEDEINNLGTVHELCTDVTIDLEGYIPYDGDYYTVDGDCGDTTLIHGDRLVGTEIILQSTDLTWHRVYVMRLNGITHLAVDQDPAAPSLTPFIMMENYPGEVYRVDLQFFGGNHHLRVAQDPTAIVRDFNVLYLEAAEDGLSYGVRLFDYLGNIHFQVSQDNTVL